MKWQGPIIEFRSCSGCFLYLRELFCRCESFVAEALSSVEEREVI
jgi:hypothetical protein